MRIRFGVEFKSVNVVVVVTTLPVLQIRYSVSGKVGCTPSVQLMTDAPVIMLDRCSVMERLTIMSRGK